MAYNKTHNIIIVMTFKALTICMLVMEIEVFFNLKSSYMSYLALSDSFEYTCYESTAITNILMLTVRESTLVVRIWRL